MRKSRPKINKKQNQIRHFEKRCLERLGFVLDYNDLVWRIQHSAMTVLGKQTNRITLFKLELRGKDYKIVYDRQRKTIVTIMPYFKEENDEEN